jgi:protein tyrosine phosphatase
MRKPLGEHSEGLFRGLVEDCLQMADQKELFLVHCSAGIGRTGTLGTMVEGLRCARREGRLSVFEIVDNMRRNRMACVQTMEQYGFIYQQLKNML